MVRRRPTQSISGPIVLASITVVLTFALLIGWIVMLARRIAVSEEIAVDVWMMVLGGLSFVMIVTVLVMFTVSLARRIIEVRRQDGFIDSVTHELKSPLASLQLCLDTLSRAELEDVQREQLRTMMLEDVDRLRSFIDDVLYANRLSYNWVVAENVNDFTLRRVVDDVVTQARARYRLDSDAVVVNGPADVTLFADKSAIEIVLRNLVDNAIKYSGERVRVSVNYSLDDATTTIEVSDHGIGIEKPDLRKIFNRFYRVPSRAVRERRGTGLGLFVVSSLVRNMGGKVSAHSVGADQGTTIRVTLPPETHGT